MEFKHKSVLLKETIDNLNVKPDGIYVDGTLGGAGHALEVCKLLSATGRLIGIDQDERQYRRQVNDCGTIRICTDDHSQ